MTSIRWLPEALDDLKRLHATVAPHSPQAAARAVDTLTEAAESLVNFPERGRPWDLAPDFRVQLTGSMANREKTIYRSKAVGEPPLMLALSAFLAIRDALADDDTSSPALQAPATPESILRALRGGSDE